MSWQESVQSELIIKTGDGLSYKPLWKNTCAKEIEYNIAQFDFPKVKGSKIDRGTPMATKFNLDIYFQGEDNLVIARNFEVSASDSRPWQISHPIYGSILVQPTGLKFDYSGFNVTQVTGMLFETLGSAGLDISIVPQDKIAADKEALDDTIVQGFNAEMELLRARELTPSDIATRDLVLSTRQVTVLKGINKTLYDIGVKSIKLTEDAGTYLNRYNVANASIEQGISQASSLMSNLQAVINFPSQMINTVQVRVAALQTQFASLRANLGSITNQSDKSNYQATGATLVSSMCTNAVNDADYKTRNEVLDQIENIQDMHDQFLSDMDLIQTDNGGEEQSFVGNSDVMTQLDDLIKFTVANLDQIALSAKQERIVILDEDSNAVILAHRFYGLQADDSTIQQFMDNNKIFLNEILQIKKGRTLSFYI
jgi:hypothetical protein